MFKKFTLIISGILFGVSSSFCQFNPVWNTSYQHTTTDNFSNESRKMVVDQNGNVFVLADVTSDKDDMGNVTGLVYSYTVLLKYSSSGSLKASINIDVNNHFVTGFNYQSAFGLVIDGAGYVYVGYNYDEPITQSDVRITKFDNDLNEFWTLKYNPGTIDYGIDMKMDPSGELGVIVKSLNGTNATYHILRSNQVAEELNLIYSFDQSMDFLNSITFDSGSNIYVTGYRIISSYKTLLTASVSSAGSLRWKNTYNGGSTSRDDVGKYITYGVDGYIYIAGTSDRGTPTNLDAVVIKYYTGNGKNMWVSLDNYGANDNGMFVNADNPQYVYLGSVSNNAILISLFNATNGTAKGRTVYTPVPQTAYSTRTGATLVDLQVSSNDNVFISGDISAIDLNGEHFTASYLAVFNLDLRGRTGLKFVMQSDITGAFNENYSVTGFAFDHNSNDLFWLRSYFRTYTSHITEVVILDQYSAPFPLRSTSLLNQDNYNSVHIFPNPVQDEVQLISDDHLLKFELYNAVGKITDEGDFNSRETYRIDMHSKKSGIYFVKVYFENGGAEFRKIIRE